MYDQEKILEFERKFKKSLLFSWVDDYQKYLKEVFFLTKNTTILPQEKKNEIFTLLKKWKNTFEKSPTHKEVFDFIKKEYEEIAPKNMDIQCSYKEIWLSKWDREKIERRLKIIQPEDGIIYRGGAARNILRIKKNIPIPSKELILDDVDLFITPTHDKQKIVEKYQTGYNSVSYIDQINPSLIWEKLLQTDLNINQLLVTKDKIFYTLEALTWLENNMARAIGRWHCIYTIPSYKKEEFLIFSGSLVKRLLKFLCEEKVETIVAHQYNLDKSNLEKNDFDYHILSLIRKFIFKNNSIELLYNLDDILHQIGYLNEMDIVDFLQKQMQEKPDFLLINRELDENMETNWILAKLIKWYKLILFEEFKDLGKNFDINNSNEKEITLALSKREINENLKEKISEYIVSFIQTSTTQV